MLFDACVSNHNLDYEQTLQEVFTCINNKARIITVFPNRVDYILKHVDTSVAPIYVAIDYPLGVSSVKSKIYNMLEMIKMGVSGLDVTINSSLLLDGELTSARDELRQIAETCKQYKKPFRFVLLNDDLSNDLIVATDLAVRNHCTDIILSNGSYMDNLVDSIIMAETLYKKFKVKVIINTRQISGAVKLPKNTHIQALQANSAHALNLLRSSYS
jgi:deoxyribose-phosphate aldolase